ncbi:MAG: hypothetical protein HY202_04350 [Nitrospirae bacterium]|nr:hypothetical protein [Nitrospirota bacterium]
MRFLHAGLHTSARFLHAGFHTRALTGAGFSFIYWTGISLIESLLFDQGGFFQIFFQPDLNEAVLRFWVIALIFIVMTGFRKEV